MELFLDEEVNLSLEGSHSEHNRIDGDGNNTIEQRRLGLDTDMIGAREDELGRARSQTQEMFPPRNEYNERAELTVEDWIQPKTWQEAWHSPVEKERNIWRTAIRKEITSMIDRGLDKDREEKIPENRRLIWDK